MGKHGKNSKVLLVAIVLVILLAVYFGVPVGLRMLGMVTPGWEIYNQVGAIRHNDVIMDSEDDFTHPQELMGVYWKVDWDNETYGVPTMMVTMGDIHHVDFTGKDIPNDQYADTMTVTRGNRTLYLDYHIYLFTVTTRTIADKYLYTHRGIGNMPFWQHETSWPHEGWDYSTDWGYDEYIGEKFSGGVYTKFVISPWLGETYRDPPSDDYVLENCWAGVMNTYVFRKEAGQVENQQGKTPDPASDAPMFFKAGIEEGNQVPMFEDDGTFGTPAPTVLWDPEVTLDSDIESTVVHYLPCEMQPGLKTTADYKGMVYEIATCDVYVMYTLRIDVLQVHGFTLETALEPPTPIPPVDWFTWSYGFWEGVWKGIVDWGGGAMDWLSNPFNQLWVLLIVAVVVVIVVSVASPGVWTVLAQTRRKGGG